MDQEDCHSMCNHPKPNKRYVEMPAEPVRVAALVRIPANTEITIRLIALLPADGHVRYLKSQRWVSHPEGIDIDAQTY